MAESTRKAAPADAPTRSPRNKEPVRAADKSQEKKSDVVAAASRRSASKRSHEDDDSDDTADEVEEGGQENDEKEETETREEEEEEEEPWRGTRRRDSHGANVRRPVAFQPSHALKFGLEVVARETVTGAVTAALCLFCKHFGREPKPGAKRRATTNFKYFKGVFRTDQYLQHLRLQHPLKWQEYDAASVQQKQVFFPRHVMPIDMAVDVEADTASSRGKTLKAKKQKTMGGGGRGEDDGDEAKRGSTNGDEPSGREQKLPAALELALPSTIVDLLRGGAPFELRALSTCGGSADGGSESSTDGTERIYRVTITDRLAFDVAVDLCASGLSTSQITRSMHAMAKYVPHSGGLVSVWGELVANYTEAATLGSLAMMRTLMAQSWAFSIGIQRCGDSKDYVSVRVRLASNQLHDFHLCHLPAATLKESLPHVLDVVHPQWRKSLIGVSVDGDVFASVCVVPAIHTLQLRATMGESVRLVWNGRTLVTRAFGELFTQLMDGAFSTIFHGLKTYVKSQAALIQEIGHEYPAESVPSGVQDENSLENIVQTARWLSEKRVRIRKYLDEDDQRRDQHPTTTWWLCLAVFDSIAGSVFRLSEDLRPTPSGVKATASQIASVVEHTRYISTAFKVEPTPDVTTASVIQYKSSDGTLATTKTSMLEFVVDLGSFVNSLLTSLRDDELEEVVKSLGGAIATYVEVLTVGLEHASKLPTQEAADASLEVVDELSVFPHELARLGGKEFDGVLGQYRELLLPRYSDEELDLIEQEHQALKRATREKEFPTWAVDETRDSFSQFDATWARTLGRFRMLHTFVTGLATIFPRETTVAHGPAIQVKADGSSDSVLDLQVEASPHAAQFHQLQQSQPSNPLSTDHRAGSYVRQTTPTTTTTIVI